MKIYLVLASMIPCLSFASDGRDGHRYLEMVFGNPDQRHVAREHKDGAQLEKESCDGYGGLIGVVNGFFCHLEKDLGIHGVGSATKSFHGHRIHAEVAANPVTINGVAYTTEASVWICDDGAADCSQTANFGRAYFVAFTFDKVAGVNKGYLVGVPGLIESRGSEALEITYDLGSAGSSQTLAMKTTFTRNSIAYNMRVTGTRGPGSLVFDIAGTQGGSGFRYASAGAPPTEETTAANLIYYEAAGATNANGFYALDSAATAAIANNKGMCVAERQRGDTDSITSGGAICSSFTLAPFDYYALTANSGSASTSVEGFSQSGILGSWQSMAAHPGSI